jgi:hypothetical protein
MSLRTRLHNAWEALFPPLSDFGVPEYGLSPADVLDVTHAAAVRECRADLPDLVSDAELLALVYGSGVPFTDRTVMHEPSAAERAGWAA